MALFRLINRRIREPWTSEDILQESYLRFLNYNRSGQTIENPGALLRRIALNLILDHFRATRRRPVEELPDDLADTTPMPDEATMHQERVRLTTETLAAMPPMRREAFVRCRLHGESRREVADALAISEAAVAKHVARAVLALDQSFARQYGARRKDR